MLIALLAAGGAVVATRQGESSTFRVHAVFDTAKGMVPGQSVKIAGAEAGKVEALELEARGGGGYKARMELRIERRFAPFHADASCRILPQGLISENFVECDPGSARQPALSRGASGVPTVTLRSTAVPASLQDLLNTFSAPASQRLRILFNELGLGTAGRGEDLNAILRRSNPALTQARRALSILASQRELLADAVGQTDRVLDELAARDDELRAFVGRSATVVRTTASRRGALGQAIRRLPAMLDALDRSLAPIKRVSQTGVPLLRRLRAAAPGLTNFNRAFPTFAEPAVPALRALGSAAATGRSAIPPARPAFSHLRKLAVRAQPVARQLDRLLLSVRDQGGFEGLGDLTYTLANLAAGYDRTSHFVAVAGSVFPRCIVENQSPGPEPTAGCSHAYYAPGMGQTPATHAPGRGSGSGPGDRTMSEKQLRTFLDYLLK
ncbi:MAG: MlaD family protein [Thermoleophilaceae bacterium]